MEIFEWSECGMALKLDNYDKLILEIMQEDGSISNLELARRIGLAQSSCLLRTKSLREKGIIARTTIIVDEKKLGYEVTAFAKVTLNPLNRETSSNFIAKIKEIPQVVECYTITGDGAFLLKIVAKDLQFYRDFVIDRLLGISAVNNVETNMVVGVEKETTAIPLD